MPRRPEDVRSLGVKQTFSNSSPMSVAFGPEADLKGLRYQRSPRRAIIGTSGEGAAMGRAKGHMRRREFILGLAMLAKFGRAKAEERVRCIGALITEPTDILEAPLKASGWVVGRNLKIEYRITRGDTDLSRTYARELLALQPDVLFAVTNTSMAALHHEHSNIPTVFVMVSDPVGMHYVENFSRPGGNTTGFTPFGLDPWRPMGFAFGGAGTKRQSILG